MSKPVGVNLVWRTLQTQKPVRAARLIAWPSN
jgi:hypothetical protein